MNIFIERYGAGNYALKYLGGGLATSSSLTPSLAVFLGDADEICKNITDTVHTYEASRLADIEKEKNEKETHLEALKKYLATDDLEGVLEYIKAEFEVEDRYE